MLIQVSRLFSVMAVSLCFLCCVQAAGADARPEESIVYDIKPLGGRAEYQDFGLVDLDGRQVKLVVFTTRVMGFKDIEKIYGDPQTLLPVRVEREIRRWISRESIVEAYDQKAFTVTIRKFKGDKKIGEQVLSADGPIYNAILLPFYLRKTLDAKVGWSFLFRLPQRFEATLVSIDAIDVGGKAFSAYHFTGVPDKFEIWISDDDLRVPVKIKGKGGFIYTLMMKEHNMSPVH
ncbi:MAG: hypothetical protein HQL17_01180 [Candidatus Omnitrophica bacterium]|nr:hypothetical protein [Candidatus Omnitrophota bacterium]